jgi:hypothetical protein
MVEGVVGDIRVVGAPVTESRLTPPDEFSRRVHGGVNAISQSLGLIGLLRIVAELISAAIR